MYNMFSSYTHIIHILLIAWNVTFLKETETKLPFFSDQSNLFIKQILKDNAQTLAQSDQTTKNNNYNNYYYNKN